MNRRQLLGAALAAPMVSALPEKFPRMVLSPTYRPFDATLTALEALSYTSQQILLFNAGAQTFSWVDPQDATRW